MSPEPGGPTTGTGFHVDRVSARVLVLDADGRVLLMRRRRPGGPAYLTTIGGGVEPGESIAEAARRECLEEAGASVRLEAELGRDLYRRGDHTTEHVFLLARLLHQDLALRHGPELDDPTRGSYEPVWLDPHDPECRDLRPGMALQLLLTAVSSPLGQPRRPR